MYDRVLVPIDGSARASRAIGHGQRLARLHDASLWLVAVATPDFGHRDAEMALEQAAGGHTPSPRTTIIEGDDAAVELARLDREHPRALVCMSTRGHRGTRRAFLGNVSAAVVRRSDQAVVLIGPRCRTAADTPINRLIVSLDGTEEGEAVLEWAIPWVDATRLQLILTHVVYPLVPPAARIPPTGDQLAELGYLAGVRDRLRTSGHEVIDMTIQHPDTPDAIADLAEGHSDCIVAVATSGPGPLTELVAGSNAWRVAASSTVPVLLVSRPGTVRPLTR
jgi:nucleotide-binding universal stress UspA family protein